MNFPILRFRLAAMAIALGVSAPAMADPASPQAPQSSPLSTSPSSLQAGQQVPDAAPPRPKDEKPSDKPAPPKPPQKGDTMVAVNWSLALNNASSGNVVEIGFDQVLGDDFQVGVLAGKKWMYYDAQYANIGMHSNGLYLTLSRYFSQGVLVQLRGGAVQDFYGVLQGPKPADFLPQPTPDGSGRAVGVSVVATFDHVNHGVFSWERYYIGGRTNDVFSVSWLLIGGVELALILH